MSDSCLFPCVIVMVMVMCEYEYVVILYDIIIYIYIYNQNSCSCSCARSAMAMSNECTSARAQVRSAFLIRDHDVGKKKKTQNENVVKRRVNKEDLSSHLVVSARAR